MAMKMMKKMMTMMTVLLMMTMIMLLMCYEPSTLSRRLVVHGSPTLFKPPTATIPQFYQQKNSPLTSALQD